MKKSDYTVMVVLILIVGVPLFLYIKYPVFFWAILVTLVLVPVLVIIDKHVRAERIKKDIYSGAFIHYKEFEKRWLTATGTGKHDNRNGFKYQDGPGCYIITIYNKPVTNGNWKKYENVYIGQSIHVCARVHAHFNGKGNGDIYADIKYGKWVYVRFVRCEEHEMNDKEIELIAAFNATKSYNKTQGGAMYR